MSGILKNAEILKKTCGMNPKNRFFGQGLTGICKNIAASGAGVFLPSTQQEVAGKVLGRTTGRRRFRSRRTRWRRTRWRRI